MATLQIAENSIQTRAYSGGWGSWYYGNTNAQGYVGKDGSNNFYGYCVYFTMPNITPSGKVTVKINTPLIRYTGFRNEGTIYYKIVQGDPTGSNNPTGKFPSDGVTPNSFHWGPTYDYYVHYYELSYELNSISPGKGYSVFFGCDNNYTSTFTGIGYSGYPFTITLEYTPAGPSYTAPSPPTSISLTPIGGQSVLTNNYYIRNGGSITLNWSGAQPGTNNGITGYRIYRSINGGSYSDIGITVNGTSYNVPDPGIARGSYSTYKVVTVGANSNSALSSTTSSRVYKNSLPSAPSARDTVIKYNDAYGILNYTPGADPDGHAISTYYATSASGSKSVYNGNSLSPGTYYLWSFDGLEYSENYSAASIIKNTAAPRVTNVSFTSAEFVPYNTISNCKCVTSLQITGVTATAGNYATINHYSYFYRKSSSQSNLAASTIVSLGGSSSANASIAIPFDKVSNGQFFQIGASAQTNLGEDSDIFWNDTIFCSGKQMSANDFSSFSIYSLIDNNREDIINKDQLSDYFNHYIRITWTNPNLDTVPYFSITNVTGGMKKGGIFTSLPMQNSSGGSYIPSLSMGASNSIYLRIPDDVRPGESILPMITISLNNGTSFEVSSFSRTKATPPRLDGSTYSTNEPVYKVFGNEVDIYFKGNSFSIFNGNKVKEILISNNLMPSLSYFGYYDEDGSSTPGHIRFNDLSSFKSDLSAIKNENINDNINNTTYTIRFYDCYRTGQSISVNQTIDFRVAPWWPTDAILTTSVSYLGDSSGTFQTIDNNTTDESRRILNPGDKIRLSWTPAMDGGNKDETNITYKVYCYMRNADTIGLKYDGGKLISSYDVSYENPTYIYTVPSTVSFDGKGDVNSIYFKITAIDESKLETDNKSLETSEGQALAIGRAIAPSFEIQEYKVDSDGILTGKLSISDYGDSRKKRPAWTNYSRLGNLILQINDTNAVSYDNNFAFSKAGFSASIKVSFVATVFPPHLSNLSSTKSYVYIFSGPTFSYRNHQIGINTTADANEFAVLSVKGEYNSNPQKTQIHFIASGTEGNTSLPNIIFDLANSNVYNLIIDGGSW